MCLPIADRMARMGTEEAFRVRARALALDAEGRDVIHLEMGEPDFPTPSFIVEAAVEALRAGHTGYTAPGGIPALREAIAGGRLALRGASTSTPAQVVVCPGAKPVIFFTILACVNAGDEVVVPRSGLPDLRVDGQRRGRGREALPAGERGGRPTRPRAARRRRSPTRTRLVVLNSPGQSHGSRVPGPTSCPPSRISAAIGISWSSPTRSTRGSSSAGRHRSIATEPGMAERTVILDGFSKTYCMTGWRLGYAVAPRPLARNFERLMTNSNSCAVNFVQHAALAALRGAPRGVEAMVETFRGPAGRTRGRPLGAARDRLRSAGGGVLRVCRRPGHRVLAPGCSRIGSWKRPAWRASKGPAFGPAGEGFLRFSFADDVARIREATSTDAKPPQRLSGTHTQGAPLQSPGPRTAQCSIMRAMTFDPASRTRLPAAWP